MARFNDEVAELTEILVQSAGKDPIQDAKFTGVILGLRALSQVDYEGGK